MNEKHSIALDKVRPSKKRLDELHKVAFDNFIATETANLKKIQSFLHSENSGKIVKIERHARYKKHGI